jgi:hypothetical protein
MKSKMNGLWAPALAIFVLTAATPGSAQDARVAGLPDYKNEADWTKYFVANNSELKTVSDLYARIDTLRSVQAGAAAPDGMIIVRAIFDTVLNDEGFPFRDANGDFTRGRQTATWVMEKKDGWGDDGGAGDWEFAAFRNTGGRIQGDGAECAECHIETADTDFIFNFDAMAAAAALLQ